jgi:transglutaminase-like putative cysteine protease
MAATTSPFSAAGVEDGEKIRTVSCDLAFTVEERAEVVLQVVAAKSAGTVLEEAFHVSTDGVPTTSFTEVHEPYGATMHIVAAPPGRLAVSYRARISAHGAGPSVSHPTDAPDPAALDRGRHSTVALYERQVYLRPSRYCPSDHLIGFAAAQFGTGVHVGARVAAIANWIRQRIGYVPGSSSVHDSAEDTLLTGMGTCRDFAHLGIALCRATGIPARFAAVYAPGLAPMDFHAVFEAWMDGRWYVYDSTGLAPRSSLVRIVTGRDAADAAFAATTSGSADLESIEVSATVGTSLPADELSRTVEMA